MKLLTFISLGSIAYLMASGAARADQPGPVKHTLVVSNDDGVFASGLEKFATIEAMMLEEATAICGTGNSKLIGISRLTVEIEGCGVLRSNAEELKNEGIKDRPSSVVPVSSFRCYPRSKATAEITCPAP